MSHTPGPWQTGFKDGTGTDWYPGEPRMGAVYITGPDQPPGFGIVAHVIDVLETDARLIAAAPDLLAALESMTKAVRAYLIEVSRAPNNRSDEVIDAAARALVDSVPAGVAAITKAKGEE